MGGQMLLARDPQLHSLALLPHPHKKLGLHAPLSKFCLKFYKGNKNSYIIDTTSTASIGEALFLCKVWNHCFVEITPN